MKVKVRKVTPKSVDYRKLDAMLQELADRGELSKLWPMTVRELPTDRLQRLVRMDKLQLDELFVVLDELARRREASGAPFQSNEEAWAEFREHYMPHDLTTPHKLTPSPQGRDCLGNGSWPGYECCCDECPHYLTCFSEFKF